MPALSALVKERPAKVLDGDTFRVHWGGQKVSGPSVRLLGLNTPETRKRTKPAEPFAAEAKERLEQLLAGQSYVYLQLGEQGMDRYGRALAYVWLENGSNLSFELVKAGLGYVVVFDDVDYAEECLLPVEQAARRASLGIWSQEIGDADVVLTEANPGQFVTMSARIRKIKKESSGVRVFVSGGAQLWISKKYFSRFTDLDQLGKGRRLLVRGWLSKERASSNSYRDAKWRITIRHPSAMLMMD